MVRFIEGSSLLTAELIVLLQGSFFHGAKLTSLRPADGTPFGVISFWRHTHDRRPPKIGKADTSETTNRYHCEDLSRLSYSPQSARTVDQKILAFLQEAGDHH